MKENKKLLFGIVLAGLIVGSVVFLCIPVIAQSAAFLLGFIACLVLVSIALLPVLARNQNRLLTGLSGDKGTTEDAGNATGAVPLTWLFVTVLIILVGLVSGYLIFRQNALYEAQIEHQRMHIAQKKELVEWVRKGGLTGLMGNVLDKIDDELENNPDRILSYEMIARIAALSQSFEPEARNYVESDSLPAYQLSQARGQLLVTLALLDLDSSTYRKIRLKTSFARANLRGMDLRGADLSNVDLMSADLKGADLSNANLKDADLRGANLWGAKLTGANLSGADMNRVDLRWADLSDADLSVSGMNGVVMTGAILRRADLSGALVRLADLSGASFIDANMVGIDMIATDLRRADLSGADLSNADLRSCNLSEATVEEANLSQVIFGGTKVQEEDWLINLNAWQVKGVEKIHEQYKIVEDLTGLANFSIVKKKK